MYGKLIENELVIAPHKLVTNGFVVYNPPADLYLVNGYYPITFTDEPSAPEGYTYESSWEQQEDTIIQVWTLVKLPDEVDPAEAFEFLFGGENL